MKVGPVRPMSPGEIKGGFILMDIRFLNRSQLSELLSMSLIIDGVKDGYRQKSQGRTMDWPQVAHHFNSDDFISIRSGGVTGGINTHGVKVISNFPTNAASDEVPYTGVLMVFDSKTGHPRGIMDASLITSLQMGASAALGTKALARPNSRTLSVIGTGDFALYAIAGTLQVMPDLKRIVICDPEHYSRAIMFAAACPSRLADEFGMWTTGVSFEAVTEVKTAATEADILYIVSDQEEYTIEKDWVNPGTHVCCLEADSSGHGKLASEFFSSLRIFCDDSDRCCKSGEISKAFLDHYISKDQILGIGEFFCGRTGGRQSSTEITFFDAIGLPSIDIAIGRIAVELARRKATGLNVEL